MFNFLKRKKRVKAQEFDAETLQQTLHEQGTAIVVAMTGWCDACRMQKPLVHDMADHHQDTPLTIGLINIDTNQDFARHHEIQSIPTTLGYKNGELVFKSPGLMSRGKLEALATELLS